MAIYKQDGTQTVWGADDEAREVPRYKPRPWHSGREVVKALGLREMARGEDRGLCTAVVDCGGGVLLYCAPVSSSDREEDRDMSTILQQLARSATSPASGSRCPLEIQRDQEDPRRVHVSLPGEEDDQPDLRWSGTWGGWCTALRAALGARS